MKRESLWARGSHVLFGQMYEDAGIEMRAFAGRTRVFCIASAGCTAMALSANHEVTAVDINRDQLTYARERAAGAPALMGRAERVIAAGRRMVRIAGWTPQRLQLFVKIANCDEQLQVWHSELDRPLFRILFDNSVTAALYSVRLFTPLESQLPARGFGRILRARLERSLSRYPNATNPYAASLFAGARLVRGPAPNPVHFRRADAATYLEGCPAGSFDAFTLSNILDGATKNYAARLKAAVRRAASNRACVVLRSFLEPRTEQEREAAAEDRSMLWGSMYLGPVESF
jgi:S-adenosylmethionine:diacylglycerol 3-amino-3-carboxypropyl transferase